MEIFHKCAFLQISNRTHLKHTNIAAFVIIEVLTIPEHTSRARQPSAAAPQWLPPNCPNSQMLSGRENGAAVLNLSGRLCPPHHLADTQLSSGEGRHPKPNSIPLSTTYSLLTHAANLFAAIIQLFPFSFPILILPAKWWQDKKTEFLCQDKRRFSPNQILLPASQLFL